MINRYENKAIESFERIPLGYVRDPKTGEITKIRTAKFKPGMVISRNGRKYRIDSKGNQRRIS